VTSAIEATRPEFSPGGVSERKAQATFADPPGAFRSLAWGAGPPAGLRKKFAGAPGGLTLYAPNSPARPADLFGVPVTNELYHFAFGRFCLGQVFLDGHGSFLSMKAALTAAYGTPAFSNDLAQVYRWVWDCEMVEVRLCYQARYEKSIVEFRKCEL